MWADNASRCGTAQITRCPYNAYAISNHEGSSINSAAKGLVMLCSHDKFGVHSDDLPARQDIAASTAQGNHAFDAIKRFLLRNTVYPYAKNILIPRVFFIH